MTNQFAGRTILITGAGRNIGAHLVSHFVERGAFVIAATKSTAVEVGKNVAQVDVDLAEVGAGVRLMNDALALRPSIEFVINNAARQDVALLAHEEPERIADLFQVNVASIAEILSTIARDGTGVESVLNITSIEALQPRPGHAIYGATKAALDALTRSAAVELAPTTRVNGLRLGLIQSPGIAAAWPEGVGSWSAHAPLKRMGQPADITTAIEYLLGATWATGSILDLDGGIGAVAPW
jgi:3-oxoacyl-[acyl-carrier protein] reductase